MTTEEVTTATSSTENDNGVEERKILLKRFQLPDRLEKQTDTETDTYSKFIAEPFERGFGYTIGNSLRRILLSSVEGAAITSIRIAGCNHEFSSLPGVVEDVTDIVLNLKKVKFRHHGKERKILNIQVNKAGVVTAGDIQEDETYQVVNKDQVICTLDRKTAFHCELEIKVGRGFHTGEENKSPDMAIGVIAIDSIFSPVVRVKYAVEATRVGQITNFDKLIIDIWTDGRLTPSEALLQASAIMRYHLDVFVGYNDNLLEFETEEEKKSEENSALKRLLAMSVNEIELSVRAANCLNNANITSVGELALKSESEMLTYRNFGKKSLNEIKDKLHELGLGLGMRLDPSLVQDTELQEASKKEFTVDEEAPKGLVDLITQNIEE